MRSRNRGLPIDLPWRDALIPEEPVKERQPGSLFSSSRFLLRGGCSPAGSRSVFRWRWRDPRSPLPASGSDGVQRRHDTLGRIQQGAVLSSPAPRSRSAQWQIGALLAVHGPDLLRLAVGSARMVKTALTPADGSWSRIPPSWRAAPAVRWDSPAASAGLKNSLMSALSGRKNAPRPSLDKRGANG